MPHWTHTEEYRIWLANYRSSERGKKHYNMLKSSIKNQLTKRSDRKLTRDEVQDIRLKFANKISQNDLAAEYGVSQPTISALCTRKTYKWVEDPEPKEQA